MKAGRWKGRAQAVVGCTAVDPRGKGITGNSYLFQGFGCLIAKAFAQNQIKLKIRNTRTEHGFRAGGQQSWLGSDIDLRGESRGDTAKRMGNVTWAGQHHICEGPASHLCSAQEHGWAGRNVTITITTEPSIVPSLLSSVCHRLELLWHRVVIS